MDLLDRMLASDRWTTARVLDLTSNLSDSQLDQPFDVGHRTMRATLEHMIFSLEVWTAAMADQPLTAHDDPTTLTALAARHEIAAGAFAILARRLSDDQRLDEAFLDPWTDEPTRRTFGTTIVHVLLHNAQHRNEALHILQRLGVPNLPDGDPKEWEEAATAV